MYNKKIINVNKTSIAMRKRERFKIILKSSNMYDIK